MATEDTKLTKNVHREAPSGDEDKKKGGKFQPFKKLFGKRKKKDTSFSREASVRQKSDCTPSVSNGTFSSDEETLEDSLRSSNYSMGTRAFSHDSIFIPDGGAESEQTVQAMSQDNILGKVKTLQRQLGKNIKFGQRPSNAIPMKKAGSGEASSEEDLFLTSPMEIVTQQDIVLLDTENRPSEPPSSPSPLHLPGAGSEMEDKVAPVKPSRPKRHFSSAGTIESVNLDAIPLAIARLDNSAAKHKLAVKPKNQRVSRKHRRLAQDGQNEPGLLESQPSLDQSGHPGEDMPICHEEEPEPLDSEEEKRRQEDYWRELEAKCKRQKAEAAEKRRQEEQRLQALERRLWEENQRQELLQEKAEEEGLEEDLTLEPAKVQQRGLEEQGCREQEQREQEAQEHMEPEEQRCLQEEAQQLEEHMLQEAERQWQEVQRLETLEAQQQETEKQRLEEEARRLEEEKARRLEEEEEARRLEEEKAKRLEEEEARRLEEEARLRELEEERQEQEEQEQARQREKLSKHEEMEAARPEDRAAQLEAKDGGHWPSPPPSDLEERPEDRGSPAPKRQGEDPEERQGDEAGAAEGREEGRSPGEPDRERRVEELRWQEVDERQSTPRPYTFQVSSGGRQILFPKVNLSPVTPAQDAGPEPAAAPPAPHAGVLPSALSIPHTAILVTGAQLCGPAVNLGQIKDTACKSLLGLSDEKRSAKPRPPPEAPGSAALAEWASIRSRILKSAEGDPRGGGDREAPRPGDEPALRGRCDSRGTLRRTPPVNAKFSIMPAWQKFSDGAEAEGSRKRPGPGPGEEPAAPQEPPGSPERPEGRPEPADTSQGCKFAKDLPSFLVPDPPAAPAADGEASGGPAAAEPAAPGAEEKASPFGIKLRRTNYSLRFHCDQQAEQKKKKRHSSSGDGADGALGDREPQALGVAAKAGPGLPPGKKSASASRRDDAQSPLGGQAPSAPQPPASSLAPAPERDKAAIRMPPMQKPALAPKPTGQTPPSSPLSKFSRPYLVELLARRTGKADSEPPKEAPESSDPQPPSPPPSQDSKEQKRDQEEGPERKLTSSLLPTSQQERPVPVPEAGRKDKPLLQSRHSLDGSKLTEKAETAQPLWITLALQKQKGFREQQASREERKQAREAKQGEKLSKENVSVSSQPGSSSMSRASSLHKSTSPTEEKKPETAVSRLQRREQLKKANTLPTSVTVEISDSAPPVPLVKEVTKRFSTPDAAPVSTEPAWLALAKRKAKAWSDCPQIIK
ncbi:capping protein-inhibiting regulator of actin dynamics isoform X2 [Perognathus longimembris pacificus]|uniref:capping protein-inhibiting regulator of actin dynamics isoform X2 n=1 Tax=Perognathus longimembris pacificus TaxID=214514 RepID=UPI0020192B3F|nr:capping protein-inhibiting regulator of actin dynamics isoform X2 [Perognathus longimembris pacificus]